MPPKIRKVALPLFSTICSVQVFFALALSAQIPTRVVIESAGSDIINRRIGNALSLVMQEANKAAIGKGDVETVKKHFTAHGFEAFRELLDKTGFFTTIREYRVKLLKKTTGNFEIRRITVYVNMEDTPGDDIQELVFVLNFGLLIQDIHFAMELHHYERLIEEGRQLNDMAKREKIYDFLEDFRTAHIRKDIDYLEKVYSDDALIIVGRVLEEKEGEDDFILSRSFFNKERIVFIRKSKREYIDALRRVFKLNAFVRVTFEEVKINQHRKYPDIYGIHVKQRWDSSGYGDEGYLFVMIDFQNPERPIIHVRSWQPEEFSDGSTVSLYDFVVE